jgi:hypothetical protein
MASPGLGILGGTAGADPRFQLDVGSVFQRTFSVWAGNLVPFFLVGLVLQLPVLVALAGIEATGASMPVLQPVLSLVSSILSLSLAGAVTYGVFQHLRGERAGFGEILRLGLSRLVPVLVTGLLTGLAIAAGICALLIPGLILMTRFWVAVPVAVIEEPGAFASMGRSAELTEGNRWRIFAIALTLGVIVFLVQLMLGLVLAVFQGTGLTSGRAVPEPAWSQALLVVLVIPLQVLNAVAPAIAYHDLRVGKEGADVEDLLRVFE